MPLPPYFEFFHRTRVVFGSGSSSATAGELVKLGVKRAVILSDQGLKGAGIIHRIAKGFGGSGVELAGIFDSIPQDARARVINAGAKFVRDSVAQGIVALGGGSVLDTAKAVGFLVSTGDEDIGKHFSGPFGIFQNPKPCMPHVAIPTTAGTGAEVTNIAVILDEERKLKGGFRHDFWAADVAILDPELTAGLPPLITAYTGFDALTHAIEGLTSMNQNPIADALGLQRMSSI